MSNAEAHQRLYDKIKAGKLRLTERNADQVKSAYLETSCWAKFFDGPFLGQFPDPDGLYTDGPQVFEDWLVEAYAANFPTKAKCRSAFKAVVKQVLKEEGLLP